MWRVARKWVDLGNSERWEAERKVWVFKDGWNVALWRREIKEFGEDRRLCQDVGGRGMGRNVDGEACHRVISLEECRLSHRQISLGLHLLILPGSNHLPVFSPLDAVPGPLWSLVQADGKTKQRARMTPDLPEELRQLVTKVQVLKPSSPRRVGLAKPTLRSTDSVRRKQIGMS